jgi:hypothetical protein
MVRRDAAAPPTPASAPKGTTVLPQGGAVFIDPRVDPATAAYTAGIAARRGGLPKADLPLHPERPPIPTLIGGPPEGSMPRTMAEYAGMERGGRPPPVAVPQPGPRAPSIIEEAAPLPQPPAQARRATVASLGLAPNDLLTEQAKGDPAYRHGPGSEFAANQPDLAARYGVMRGGQYIPAQRLGRTGAPSLSPQTVADLERLRQLQDGATAPGLDQSEADGRKAVTEGLGGSAARVGGVSQGDPIKPPGESAEDRNKVLKAAIDQMDAFEFSQWRQLTMRQILHSEEEREAIESRLKPLDLGDLLRDGHIRQRIPIIPGKYEVTLQSYEGQVELALKRLIMMEARSVDVGEQYLLDKHSFMAAAVGLHKINDKVYPEIVDKDGVFNDELFLKKFNMVMRLPIHMLASIGVNLMWFEMRVRKLYSASAVGNG